MIVNFAERAHNHNWEVDPVIRSLLDTDFYKLLMLQFIWKNYQKTQVSFSLFNRTSSVRLADMFATREITDQLEHVRKLRFRKSALVAVIVCFGRNMWSKLWPPIWAAALSEPQTLFSHTSTTSRQSAQTRMNSRWSWPRSPVMTTRLSKTRNTMSSNSGNVHTKG